MIRFGLMAVLLSFATSKPTAAMMMFVEGNSPFEGANYLQWPGLLDAINDESRVLQVWVNGAETFYYDADTEATNRLLSKYAKTQVPGLEVVLFPAPRMTAKILAGVQKSVDVAYNVRIEIYGGITAVLAKRESLEQLMPDHPVMVIWLTEAIDLHQLTIPDNLKVTQLSDRMKAFEEAAKSDNVMLANMGQQQIDLMVNHYRATGEAYRDFNRQVHEIETYLLNRQGAEDFAKPPEQTD